jgi:very-short-patch-repair endonuclease
VDHAEHAPRILATLDAMDQPLDVTRPFTTAQALHAGITAAQLRGPLFRQLGKGVYVSAGRRPGPLLNAEAALITHAMPAYASHFSSARVYKIPVPDHPDEHVSVLDPGQRRRRSGVCLHVAPPAATVLTMSGVPLSPPAQTFVELAEYLPLVDLVVAGDFIVRKQWCTPEELVAFCRASKDRHAGKALRAAKYVREGVDSPMETRLRMLIVLAGLPEPLVNFKVYDGQGNVRRRFDLSYPGLRVIVEYDGRQHAEDSGQYDSDIFRREELDDGEWRIVVVTAKGIYQNPEETLRRIVKVLKARGASNLPPRLSDKWRAHFPGYTPMTRSS